VRVVGAVSSFEKVRVDGKKLPHGKGARWGRKKHLKLRPEGLLGLGDERKGRFTKNLIECSALKGGVIDIGDIRNKKIRLN